MNKSISTYLLSNALLIFIPQNHPLNKNHILIQMLFHTFLLNSENAKNKDGKNVTIDYCHFSNKSLVYSSENNSPNKYLLKADNANDGTFSTNIHHFLLIKMKKCLYLYPKNQIDLI